jgi:flavin reductase (DIM6/NTAB) family NADH-FMN oxidoreductase RutF
MSLDHALDPREPRRVFSTFPTGVVAIAALVDGAPVGLAATSFTSVSLDPPIVSLCVAHSSTTWPVLRAAHCYGISVLSVDQEQACRQLSRRGIDRFATLDWRVTEQGAMFLDGASAWLDCRLIEQITAGDHDIVLLRVHDLGGDVDIAPLSGAVVPQRFAVAHGRARPLLDSGALVAGSLPGWPRSCSTRSRTSGTTSWANRRIVPASSDGKRYPLIPWSSVSSASCSAQTRGGPWRKPGPVPKIPGML